MPSTKLLPQPAGSTSSSLRCQAKTTGYIGRAVTATLEMESYATTKTIPAQVPSIDASEDTTVAVVSPQDKLTNLIEKLLERVERLETNKSVPPSRATRRGTGSAALRSGERIGKPDDDESPKDQSRWRAPPPTRQSLFQGSCWRCGKRGHVVRKCQQQVRSDNTHIFQVNPTGGYRISGKVNGISASFLVDTGSAVTLIRDDIWRQTQIASNRLEPWTGRHLLEVDGSPLQIHRWTEAELDLGGRLFTTDMVIAAGLSNEAILGRLDFLEKIGATIDLLNNKIILADQGGSLMLEKIGATIDLLNNKIILADQGGSLMLQKEVAVEKLKLTHRRCMW